MKVEIHRNQAGQPIVYREVDSAYAYGEMYCVLINGEVHKYPLSSIFRVIESKAPSSSDIMSTLTVSAHSGRASS